MAKAASPVRLENTLMEAATVAGSILHRSAAEQIEYWADLGRRVSTVVSPETLLAISAGLAKITVEKTAPDALDPDAVFAALDRDRHAGVLSDAITSGAVRYQAASDDSGLLEQIHPDGTVLTGQFRNGKFRAQKSK